MSAVKWLPRALRWAGIAVAALVALGAALFVYFIYSPAPESPHLSGSFRQSTLEVAGIQRRYTLYLPARYAPGAPVVFALHGSDGNANSLRLETGYAFDRLADRYGFALVYPNGFEGNWNACNIVGDYAANTRNIDDVGFLTALVDQLAGSIAIDRGRVFAVGVSRGGQMAYRLALEAPMRFRAVAAIAANLPTADNFKCHPGAGGGTSVMIMNGKRDPLNPFEGGEVRLLGMYSRGSVMSAHDSAQFFANLSGIANPPTTSGLDGGEAGSRSLWRRGGFEVELVGLDEGGHSLPQPYRRAPRILGPTAMQFDGAGEIWRFFERQQPRTQAPQ
jgi:polyhydroxybutyrate depolymerase